MMKIKEMNDLNGTVIIEDCITVNDHDWNGEVWTLKSHNKEVAYKPVYEQIDEDTVKLIGVEQI